MKITCIIVDDEPLAVELTRGYINNTDFLDCKASFSSAVEASNYIQSNKVDLIFLDIQMPELTGIAFSTFVPKETRIIFTTAFSEFAIEGYRVNALDYLLKPFNYEEFMRAAIKAKEWFDITNEKAMVEHLPAQKDHIYVKSEYRYVRINLSDVLYFEGLKDYIKIWLVGQPKAILTIMSLKSLEDALNENGFMRVHRSFIVNTNYIQSITRSELTMQNQMQINIADQYKKQVIDYLSGQSL